jgi:uncharacterized membrane protein
MEEINMWIRSVLKDQAKTNLRGKYWMAFAVSLIVGFLGGSSGSSFSGSGYQVDTKNGLPNFNLIDTRMLMAALPLIIFGGLAFLVFKIFIGNTIVVGGNRWFSRNREAAAAPAFGQVFSLFRGGSYLKTVCSMLWKDFILFLWDLLPAIPFVIGMGYVMTDIVKGGEWYSIVNSPDPLTHLLNALAGGQYLLPATLIMLAALLLRIPFLIKLYSYRMTPWILADNPQIGYRRALRLSIDLTRGHRWSIFILDLSFIGWWILGFLACCIGMLFVAPYVTATEAELYAALRQNGVAGGSCTMEELGFVAVAQQTALPRETINY